MRPHLPKVTRPALVPLVVALSTLLVAFSAQAALIDSISVSLFKPNGVEQDATDNAPLTQQAPLATGILAGDGGPIGSFMLINEQISFSGDSIRIRVGAGSVNGLDPGYGAGARYAISGLSVIDALITGFNVSTFDGFANSGFTGLASPGGANSLVQLQIGALSSTLSLDLSNALTFVDRSLGGSNNFAEFRIDLQSRPGTPPPPPPPPNAVPEPGMLALVAMAGLGLALTRRKQAPGRG